MKQGNILYFAGDEILVDEISVVDNLSQGVFLKLLAMLSSTGNLYCCFILKTRLLGR